MIYRLKTNTLYEALLSQQVTHDLQIGPTLSARLETKPIGIFDRLADLDTHYSILNLVLVLA